MVGSHPRLTIGHDRGYCPGSLMVSLLGLEPNGFGRQLRVVRPVMPSFVHELELRGLRVAGAEADLLFERPSPDSALQARVLDVRGDLEVVVEP